MPSRIVSRDDILALMVRLGRREEIADAAQRLPAEVDLDRDAALLAELHLGVDNVVNDLGGSAW